MDESLWDGQPMTGLTSIYDVGAPQFKDTMKDTLKMPEEIHVQFSLGGQQDQDCSETWGKAKHGCKKKKVMKWMITDDILLYYQG